MSEWTGKCIVSYVRKVSTRKRVRFVSDATQAGRSGKESAQLTVAPHVTAVQQKGQEKNSVPTWNPEFCI